VASFGGSAEGVKEEGLKNDGEAPEGGGGGLVGGESVARIVKRGGSREEPAVGVVEEEEDGVADVGSECAPEWGAEGGWGGLELCQPVDGLVPLGGSGGIEGAECLGDDVEIGGGAAVFGVEVGGKACVCGVDLEGVALSANVEVGFSAEGGGEKRGVGRRVVGMEVVLKSSGGGDIGGRLPGTERATFKCVC
jgi:hypothetical protein